MKPDAIQLTISELRELLGEQLSTGDAIREAHSHDEAYSAPVLPDGVVFPRSTAEVSAIVKICARHKCPIVPFGAGTSLEGHVVPVRGGISVDTSLMDQVLAIHTSDLDAVVEPGVRRKQLNEALKETGLMFTVDPGADASIGGMAATRASGTNTVRYGSMRENVLALEVVLPDGQIITTGTRARKSSSGYDLTRLFVGSEGTLGIITKITVRLFGQPETIASAVCSFGSVDNAVDTVIMAIQLGIPMARIELLDALQIKGMNLYNSDMNLPEKPHLFLEFHGTPAYVAEQIESFKDIGTEFGMSDFDWAHKTEDRNRLWAARHNAYYAGKALRKGATGMVTDICVPISELAGCIAHTKSLVAASGLIAPMVGHVGDGNFHLQILVEPDNPQDLHAAHALVDKVNEAALEFGGTITGEHGIGLGKRKYMDAEHGAAYQLMGLLKKTIDPDNIMNPEKLVTLN